MPGYLWGDVNYDSDGDCKRLDDREWTYLYLQNRESRETVEIWQEDATWYIEGDGVTAARVVMFLVDRCNAIAETDSFRQDVGEWDHAAGMKRAELVASEFASR
ncbi:MAG TPA: hypothetical protein P5081_11600 [Phycisphaerae bacterium]|nr:hypothetical protein [Phycisphaerae bacterium]HRW53525.1 hypothetical protein [Phycisphaerae bacterium]